MYTFNANSVIGRFLTASSFLDFNLRTNKTYSFCQVAWNFFFMLIMYFLFYLFSGLAAVGALLVPIAIFSDELAFILTSTPGYDLFLPLGIGVWLFGLASIGYAIKVHFEDRRRYEFYTFTPNPAVIWLKSIKEKFCPFVKFEEL